MQTPFQMAVVVSAYQPRLRATLRIGHLWQRCSRAAYRRTAHYRIRAETCLLPKVRIQAAQRPIVAALQ